MIENNVRANFKTINREIKCNFCATLLENIESNADIASKSTLNFLLSKIFLLIINVKRERI